MFCISHLRRSVMLRQPICRLQCCAAFRAAEPPVVPNPGSWPVCGCTSRLHCRLTSLLLLLQGHLAGALMITAGAAANVQGNSFLGNSFVGYGNFGGASDFLDLLLEY